MKLTYQVIREERVDSIEEVLFASYQKERRRLQEELSRGEISSVQYNSTLAWVEILRKSL